MSRFRISILPSVALVVAANSATATAQQRVEVTTRRPTAAESEPLRRLQRQLDSLTQRYYEDEELTTVERRRFAQEITLTVQRLKEMVPRADEEMRARMLVRVAPSSLPKMPTGWIGIVAEGAGMEPRIENGQIVVRYLSYPRIVSVDPSSPAQAAGIVPNDTLLAYDGRDVREYDINLNQLLTPNQKVSVRLRHDGRTREVPVTIAVAPSRIALRRNDEVRDDRTIVIATAPDGPMIPRAATPLPAGGGMARSGSVRAPMAPSLVIPGFLSISGVAGASLVTISEGLGKRLGVSSGVLVTSAPIGSPASESGLEDGDVIVKISAQPVRTVLDVRRAVGSATENGQRSVEIELLRDSRLVKTTLRW